MSRPTYSSSLRRRRDDTHTHLVHIRHIRRHSTHRPHTETSRCPCEDADELHNRVSRETTHTRRADVQYFHGVCVRFVTVVAIEAAGCCLPAAAVEGLQLPCNTRSERGNPLWEMKTSSPSQMATTPAADEIPLLNPVLFCMHKNLSVPHVHGWMDCCCCTEKNSAEQQEARVGKESSLQMAHQTNRHAREGTGIHSAGVQGLVLNV